MPRGFSGNLIFAIIARMLCGNHLNIENVVATYNAEMEREAEIEQQYPRIMEK